MLFCPPICFLSFLFLFLLLPFFVSTVLIFSFFNSYFLVCRLNSSVNWFFKKVIILPVARVFGRCLITIVFRLRANPFLVKHNNFSPVWLRFHFLPHVVNPRIQWYIYCFIWACLPPPTPWLVFHITHLFYHFQWSLFLILPLPNGKIIDLILSLLASPSFLLA